MPLNSLPEEVEIYDNYYIRRLHDCGCVHRFQPEIVGLTDAPKYTISLFFV